MKDFENMVWIEQRKAWRSRLPVWTALGALILPLAIAFLVFVARNPQISAQLGLVGAKANLVAYAGTDWPAYVSFLGLIVAAGGFFLFVLILSWVFGREFVDGTVKDLLAVPVARFSILLAKFSLAAVWSVGLVAIIYVAGLACGVLLQLPGGSAGVVWQQSGLVVVTALLVIVTALPFAFLASAGRGYLLPLGLAALILMFANLAALLGLGAYFPWSIPGLYAQGKTPLGAVSILIVIATGAIGILATYWWWKYADQSK